MQSDELDIQAVARVTSPNQIELPFYAYQDTAEENKRTLQAAYLLYRQCAERFGSTYTAPVGANPSPEWEDAHRYGIINAKRAAAFGYRPPDLEPDVAAADDKSGASAWNPSPKEQLVVRGGEAPNPSITDASGEPLPAGGCGKIVSEQLGFASKPGGLQEASLASFEFAQADERVQAAWDEWADCMREKGYDYKSPWDPNNADWPEEVTQKEIQTASDDVACRVETNLVGIWMAVEAAYQKQSIEENPEAFAELKSWHEKQIKTVSEILIGSPGE